ncbi:MAG: ankyrin repeat domain-containing protein [Pseudomonadota bacterium]
MVKLTRYLGCSATRGRRRRGDKVSDALYLIAALTICVGLAGQLASQTDTLICIPDDAVMVDLASGPVCVRGVSDEQLERLDQTPVEDRVIEWSFDNLFVEDPAAASGYAPLHQLAESWPQGALRIRMSAGGLPPPQSELVPYYELGPPFEGIRLPAELTSTGPIIYFPIGSLFQEGPADALRGQCRLQNFDWQTIDDGEVCEFSVDLGHTSLTMTTVGGEFLDGTQGWPRVLTEVIDGDAWTISTLQFYAFRLHAISEAVRFDAEALALIAATGTPAEMGVALQDVPSDAVVSARWGRGNTLLHAAVLNETRPEMIALLMQAGAGVDDFNGRGETPLHSAIRNNHPAIAMALIEAGARLDIATPQENGQSAFDLCDSILTRAEDYETCMFVMDVIEQSGAP